jgi:tripartite ATP-independent transporter DctM subunit
MTPLEIGFYSIAAVIVLLAFRIPIGVVLGGVSFIGIAELRGIDVAFGMLKSVPFDFAARWELSAIPMFLLMGAIAHYSGISAAIFRAARVWLSGLPGGLAIASNFACAGFAAASGSSVATAAAMGRIAIPEMLNAGYDRGLATGVVASAGTLGSMIPPSILFVLYGIFAEVSITKLLIAGVLPGILTAAVYAIMIYTRCSLRPELAPASKVNATWSERFKALGAVWPLMLLILGIIGGLYGGLVTPTEAGAFGAFLALFIAFVQRRLNYSVLRDSVIEAVVSNAAIFFIAIGAVLLTKLVALAGIPPYLGKMIADWSVDPLLLVLATTVVYLVLGMFLDPLGIMLITLSIFLPMFEALDLDLIWFGVLVVKYLEIGLLTPPVGFNVYVIKSIVGDEIPLETIFKGVTWFLVCEIVVVALLVAFPDISLWLPRTME